MTEPELVAMTRSHISALMAHEQQMFGTEAWTADSYRAELADRRHRRYLAAEQVAADGTRTLLGWAGVRVVGGTAEILTVGVVPDARRRGVATRLLGALLAAARERGAHEVFLEVRVDNDGARLLYTREGFEQVGLRRGYYEGGRVDAVVMRRGL